MVVTAPASLQLSSSTCRIPVYVTASHGNVALTENEGGGSTGNLPLATLAVCPSVRPPVCLSVGHPLSYDERNIIPLVASLQTR